MSWRDSLRPASFRGVKFYVSQSDATVGRRVVVHEYLMRDKPLVEDLGAVSEGCEIEAYVLGADYLQLRDELLDALRAQGAGILVHPTLGELWVRVNGEARYSESTKEGGMCRFRIPFIQDDAAQYPDVAAATQDRAALTCDAAADAATDAFGNMFSVIDRPLFVLQAAQAQLSNVTAAIGDASRFIRTLPAGINDIVTSVSDFSSAVTDLIQAPSALASRIFGLFDVMVASVENPLSALDGLRQLFSFGANDTLPAQTTPSRIQQAANQTALTMITQQAAVIAAVRAVTSASAAGDTTTLGFDSYDQAVTARIELVQQLDRIADQTADDNLYTALTAMRVALCQDIAERTADLARLQTRTLPEPMPALALAYQLYGDIERADDVVARNRVPNPLLVPAGRSLEVLA